MPTNLDPVVTQWYRPLTKGEPFQVTAFDEAEGTVEIQRFDGDVEELDLDSWRELELEMIEQPEDWTGPIDDIERDDLGYTETNMSEDDWNESARERTPRRRETETEGEEGEEE